MRNIIAPFADRLAHGENKFTYRLQRIWAKRVRRGYPIESNETYMYHMSHTHMVCQCDTYVTEVTIDDG